jgi:hypothetical protein
MIDRNTNVQITDEALAFAKPMLGDGAVNLVSLFGYWHLHRVLNDKHYFGFSDHRIGLSIRTETADKVKDWTPREFKIWQSFTTKEGKLIEYWDEPYTESQIKSFGNLTLEELERWIERGT